jgi:hypothetical protein
MPKFEASAVFAVCDRGGVTSSLWKEDSMILGMSTATYTFLHVLISLVGIASGFVVLFGLLTKKRLDRWTALFLITTAATSVTGFGFPFQ